MSAKFAILPEELWMKLPSKWRLYSYLSQRCMKESQGGFGTWHKSATEIGQAISMKPDTVHRATKFLVDEGWIATNRTLRGDGFNGHLVYAVLDQVPEGWTAEQAIRTHASKFNQFLLAPDETSVAAPDETSAAAPDETSAAMEKNDKNKNDKEQERKTPAVRVERRAKITMTSDLIRAICPGMPDGQARGLGKFVDEECGTDQSRVQELIKYTSDLWANGERSYLLNDLCQHHAVHMGSPYEAWEAAKGSRGHRNEWRDAQ